MRSNKFHGIAARRNHLETPQPAGGVIEVGEDGMLNGIIGSAESCRKAGTRFHLRGDHRQPGG